MGKNIFDQYSLLHFASGIIAYFLNIKLMTWIILHTLFEIIENNEFGMKFINTHLHSVWTGGKNYQDSFANSMIGDNFFAIIGWLISYHIGKFG